MATIGQVGNVDHENVNIGKAGRKPSPGLATHRPRLRHEPERPPARRWRGQEPDRAVRSSAYSVGKPALGYKTRKHQGRSDKLHREAPQRQVSAKDQE